MSITNAGFIENIEITTLPNGVRVVSETVSHVQSISLGLWVGVGSRDEDMPVRGVTHFIEHMLFKGTARRDARTIADEIESRGGSLNAFTDKEYTCYYAKALAEHAPIVMDVLTDMLTCSLLDPDELRREQNVVLEEIKRYKDTPDDIVHDVFMETLWNTHPLGRPVIGIEKTVAALTRDSVRDYMATHYTPDRMVVAAAGSVPHAEVVRLAEKHLGHLTGTRVEPVTRLPHSSGKQKILRKKTEQVHFCYGTSAFRQSDDDRFVLTILDSVLGGNMSSRLFQEVREKRGLAYSIGTYSVAYREGGLFAVFGGTSPDTFDEVMDLTRTELEKVKRDNLTDDEVTKAKTQVRGALVLGLENMSSRMMRMGRSLLYFNRVIPLNEIVNKINDVSLENIDRVTNQLFTPERMTLAAVGPFKKSKEAADA